MRRIHATTARRSANRPASVIKGKPLMSLWNQVLTSDAGRHANTDDAGDFGWSGGGRVGQRYPLGMALLKEGRTTEASRELRAALREAEMSNEKGPGLGAILDGLGQVEFVAGLYRTAEKYFERSLKVPGREPAAKAAALSNAGQAYMALGENHRAEEHFRQAMTLMPDDPGLWHRLGQAMLSQGRHAEAELAFRKALVDGDVQVLNDLAGVLEIQKRRGAAIALLRDAVARSPAGQSRARMLRNLAVLEWKGGDRQTAANLLREALAEMETAVGAEHPDMAYVLNDYAAALGKTGDKVRSGEAANRAKAIRSIFAGQDGRSTVGWRDLRK
jgi:tetratricopeptide (TPR) repeat protein